MDRTEPGRGDIAAFDGHQYVLLRRHYYLPLPDARDIASIRGTELIGCEFDPEACFSFHDEHVARFDAEFRSLPHNSADSSVNYHLVNGTFMAVDGNMYYGLIRSFAPKRIVEIGSGNSTRLACDAIRRNRAEGRSTSHLTCIEPFHTSILEQLPEVSEIRREYVQDVGLEVFTSLEAGDILFIDSTHTVRPGGDVWWEICEILPRIKPGVLVHFHDISLPLPYPARTLENHWYWMEQYFLQAFLSFNKEFSVVWAGNYLMQAAPARMTALFGEEYAAMRSAFPDSEPASLWLRRAA
ncbi:MAG: class I SAM-dependent methyltransferase [Thermomonas sp.]|uniref:class I SAM-dependent methyltransferase n=1 Tax=Thermomonas sp. TaxID=1971895 RepID=UPI0026220015|nr:class I SAM-dependent methyltransferase [Thermomonas sp.]MCC7096484.1 class I SAM-dependent methyltransferase [Thermomonas sp.]